MKERTMLRRFAALLCALALLLTLAACGGNNQSSTPAPAEEKPVSTPAEDKTETPKEEAPADDLSTQEVTGEITYPLENAEPITWWFSLYAPEYESSLDKNIVWQQIEADTGVDIQWIHPASGTASESLNMLLVSDDLPDVVQIDDLPDVVQIDGLLESSGGAASLVADGVAVDLTDHLLEWSPDYVKAITLSDLDYSMATTADGRVVQYLQIKQTAPQYRRSTVRNDIMEEIGWGDRLPVTIADYTEMFQAMKDKGYYGYRTNRNGRDDQFMFAYGIYTGFYIKEDGKVGYGMWSDAYREYLKQVRSWIEAGYVHPDWTSPDFNTASAFANKMIGFYITPSDVSYDLAKSSGYEITCINYPRLNSADDEFRLETTTWDPVPADGIRTMVSANCEKNGHLETAMKLLNYGYTKKGADLFNWGVEGQTYTVDANGNKQFTDLILNNDRIPVSEGHYVYKLHLGPKMAEADVVCCPGTMCDPTALFWRLEYSDDPTVNSDGIIFASLTVDQSTARGDIMVNVETFMNESTMKFLLGEIDINDDAEWENYMSTMQTMGIEDAIAITQEAVDNFNAKSIPTDWAFH